LPKVNYDPGGGAVDLLFARGPNGFRCFYHARVHDNLSTSGAARERVTEGLDMLITFTMPALKVADDYAGWMAFSKFALGGGQFTFCPNVDHAENAYHCLSDDQEFAPARVGPQTYTAAFQWRIVPDGSAPADPGVVMQKFYGV